MECNKTIKLLGSTINQSSKFRTKNWVEVNDYRNNGEYEPNSQIRFKTTMIKLSPCDYSDARIFVKGTTITGVGVDATARNGDARNKQVTFKYFPLLFDCISEINNTQIDNEKKLIL